VGVNWLGRDAPADAGLAGCPSGGRWPPPDPAVGGLIRVGAGVDAPIVTGFFAQPAVIAMTIRVPMSACAEAVLLIMAILPSHLALSVRSS
jgi:hypothetical protein